MQVQNSNSKLANATPAESLQLWLVSQLAEQLSIDPNSIDVSEPLTRYGLDSIDAVTLVGELEDWLEEELPSTLFWDYPTIAECSEYLVSEFDVSEAVAQFKADAQPELGATGESEPASEPASEPVEAGGKSGMGGLWSRLSGR